MKHIFLFLVYKHDTTVSDGHVAKSVMICAPQKKTLVEVVVMTSQHHLIRHIPQPSCLSSKLRLAT